MVKREKQCTRKGFDLLKKLRKALQIAPLESNE